MAQVKRWGALRWTIAVLSAIYASVFIYMLIARPGTQKFYEGFFNVYQILPPVFGAICGWIVAVRGKEQSIARRIGWALIGTGSLSFAIGQGTWTYLETFRGVEVPFPGWPDAGYLGAYPCLIAGMILFFTSAQVAGRARILLDGAIAAAALGTVSWYFMIGQLWAKADVSLFGRIVSVGYPLGDVSIIFMAIVAFNSLQGDRSGRRSMALLGIGMILVAFADTVFTFMTLQDTYKTGSWADWGWSFGWLLLAFASLNRLWNPAADSLSASTKKSAASWLLALRAFSPYIAVAGALGLTFGYDRWHNGRLDITKHGEVVFLIAMIVVRQVFMIVENLALARRISAVNDDLERRVDERTRQITCIQELTRAVNMTLDADLVAVEGAKHTAGLLDADAVAIWFGEAPGQAPEGGRRQSGFPLRANIGFDSHAGLLETLSSKAQFAKSATVGVSEVLEDGSQATCLFSPLFWREEQLGVVVALRWNRVFEPSEHKLMEVVAVELGSAVHNSLQHAAAVEAADRDPVTGLLNHRAFHQRFRSALAKAEKSAGTVSLMMLDLNNFKLFNDTYGHMAGDHVLKTVARTLKSSLPAGSVCARYGGDEFVVSLSDAGGEDAERAAAELADRLAGLGFTCTGDDRKIPITLSAGIATFPQDASTHHDLLAVADQNLYAAKASEAGIVRTSEQQRENRALRAEGSFEVLDALVTAVDNKDRYTRKHSEDVTEYALWMAEELGLSQDTMRVIRTAGLLHDVGKIGVPSEILRKPDRLTPEEYEIIKRHPRLGELIVGAVPGMEPIIDGVRSHHERWDGQGYPDQLGGEDIPFLGRLLAVADAFSAMTTDRPYRRGMNWDAAIKQIEDNRGTQFDPVLADVFLRAVSKRKLTDAEAA